MSSTVSNASNFPLVDKLIEDEAEREILLSKPTCFIIIGKPVSFQHATLFLKHEIKYFSVKTYNSISLKCVVTLCDYLYYFQGVGKSTLARKLAKTWNCIFIDGKRSSA